MTARRAVLAAALLLATTPAARADEGHLLSASCTASRATLLPPSRYEASAQSGGHLRPVSTTVECSVRQDELLRDTFRGTMPGPYVVAESVTDDTWAGENATVCVTAWAYWSDGHTLATPTTCGTNTVSVQAAS